MENNNHGLTIKKIGITGATGFLGSNMVLEILKNIKENSSEELSKNDIIIKCDEIRCFYSKTRWNPLLLDEDNPIVSYRKLNILNKEECLNNTMDLDLIIHFAGFVSFNKKDRENLWKINVQGTENILAGAIKNKVKKFILISSISILNLSLDGKKVDENLIGITDDKTSYHSFQSNKDPLTYNELWKKGNKKFLKHLRMPYADTKLASYLVAKEIAIRSDIDFITLLPGTVIGKGDNHYSITKLVNNVYKNKLFFSFPGYTSYVHVLDLCRGIWEAIFHAKSLDTYIITGDKESNYTFHEMMQKTASYLREKTKKGINRFFIKTPKWLSTLIAFFSETLNPKTDIPLGLVYSGYEKSKVCCDKAKKELHYQPGNSFDDSINDLCQDFLDRRISEIHTHKKYFDFMNKIAITPWAKSHGKIILRGEENITGSPRRVYIVNHPTTFDIYTLIHMCSNNYYIPVDYKAFQVPVAGFFMKKAGFIPVYPKDNKHIFPTMQTYGLLGYPIVNSIRSGDVTLGIEGRLRTGGAVMADLCKADIIPLHIHVEKGKIIQKKIFSLSFKFHPYSFYKSAYNIVSFLPPLKYKDYHKESMNKTDYMKIMETIDKSFKLEEKDIQEEIQKNSDYFNTISRKGGTDHFITL